eukprot:3568362-Pyramimonas_sp.AAC.1
MLVPGAPRVLGAIDRALRVEHIAQVRVVPLGHPYEQQSVDAFCLEVGRQRVVGAPCPTLLPHEPEGDHQSAH